MQVGIKIAKGGKPGLGNGLDAVPIPKKTPKNYEDNPATGKGMGIGIEPVK